MKMWKTCLAKSKGSALFRISRGDEDDSPANFRSVLISGGDERGDSPANFRSVLISGGDERGDSPANFRSVLIRCSALALSLFVCSSAVFAKEDSMESGIKSLMQMQSDAWNGGNLEKFMSGYLQSKDVCYTAGGNEVWGYDAINARYKSRYGSNTASMGKVSFSELKIIPLGDKNALCIGHWKVEKNDSSSVGGVFSLVFVKTSDGWRILHDHTSTSAKS